MMRNARGGPSVHVRSKNRYRNIP